MPDAKQNLAASEMEKETRAQTQASTEGDGAGRVSGAEARRDGRREMPEPSKAERQNSLLELVRARVRETLREPEVIFWVFVFPILLTFALGIAFRNTAPEKVRVAVETAQEGGGSQMDATALSDALSRSDEVEVERLAPDDAAQALRSGKVALVVRARDASKTLEAQPGQSGAGASSAIAAQQEFDYRFDPTRPESRLARLVVDDVLQRAKGRADAARVREERVTEPGARYVDFLIPGLIGMNLMGSGLWGVGFSIVTARMRKLLKRLAATPMRRSQYLLSFVLSRMIFLGLEVAVVIAFAWFAFGYTVRGSWIEMTLLLLLGALAFAGLGLLVAARAATIEGVSGLMNVVMMPMWLLSGTFFSSERFPAFLQPFIKALPLTALNDALRAVMNEGAPLSASWAALCILAAWCVLTFILALRLFRWQ